MKIRLKIGIFATAIFTNAILISSETTWPNLIINLFTMPFLISGFLDYFEQWVKSFVNAKSQVVFGAGVHTFASPIRIKNTQVKGEYK